MAIYRPNTSICYILLYNWIENLLQKLKYIFAFFGNLISQYNELILIAHKIWLLEIYITIYFVYVLLP